MEPPGRANAVLSVIRTVAATGSTNADLLALARAGAADEGLWLRAEQQTAGRGRQGRTWVSPPGNLYASTVVRLRDVDLAAATLGFVAAVALEDVVSMLIRRDGLMLKWPNDLLIDGAKLSGILLERAEDAVVIGFGVNLAHHPALPDRLTTSLAAQGCAVAPAAFVAQLAERLTTWLARWREGSFDSIRGRWLERAHPPGTPLRASLPDGSTVNGSFEDLDAHGALILRLASGERRVIHAGDVFLV
ncbi:biotin--[acetyl-CoA-carboxylase] ligase [Sphingomonas bacterium]|uniref:biotin--[acetyl-CoA-carboxylase] ligase n=1 Tax=Sphingomonas bacterium TaxID=1895847 RepID=UPI00262CD95B|nr:biotin--[acetyl-CoA-carboxylase] ligase [Sphingomonas bacterium]